LKRGIVCALQQRDAGIILLRRVPDKRRKGFFYSLNAAHQRPGDSDAQRRC
jgi:hypothetical protein